MLRHPIRLVALIPLTAVALATAPLSAASNESAHVSDPGGQLSIVNATEIEARLERVGRATGVRVVMQFHEKSPEADEDKVAGAVMRSLSDKLGLLQDGVLVVYFADEKDWRMWVGNNLASRFAGKPGSVKELTDSGAMHEAKEAWFREVFARAETALKMSAEDPQPGDRVARVADEIAVGLYQRFAPPKKEQ